MDAAKRERPCCSCRKYSRTLLRCRIFVTEQTVSFFILLNFGEPPDRRIESVVSVVIVALADLAQKNSSRSRLDLEIMVHILLNVDTLARCQAYLCPSRHRVRPAVAVDGQIRFAVNGLVGQAVIDPNEDVTTAAIDNVFGLVPVEMVRGILPFLHV